MLHDPSHHTPLVVTREIEVSDNDRNSLRELAGQKADIGSLPTQQEKTRLWTALNDLKSEHPMVWINEICWNEMDVNDEFKLQCKGIWAREQEELGVSRLINQYPDKMGEALSALNPINTV